MARVMLVNPPWYSFLGTSSSEIPVGLVSLAGVLLKAGHEVAVFNSDLFGSVYASDLDVLRARDDYTRKLGDDLEPIWQLVRERIQRWAPEVVGVHAKTSSWASARTVARIAKEVQPNVMTVCGGPHMSCVPEDVADNGSFDYAVVGEGERALVSLLEADTDEERSRVPGVIDARLAGTSEVTSSQSIGNLDDLPYDGRKALMDLSHYDKLGLGAVITARGCPFQCEYCASFKIWSRRVRFRSAENVLAEIDHLADEYGVTYFKFCDDTFTVNKNRAHRICEMLRKRKKLRWKCTTRADCLDDDLVEAMRSSGCAAVSIGVESGSPRILELMHKGESREAIASGCRILREHRIPFTAFIMVGFPTETEQEAWETLAFAKSLGADSLAGSILTPYPGTGFYRWAKEHGRLPAQNDWLGYYHQNDTMGLWDLPTERSRDVTAEWFRAIERYNERSGRLVKRFLTTLRNDPVGTVRKSGSLARRLLRTSRRT